MSRVRVKPELQVPIPRDVQELVNWREGDILEVEAKDQHTVILHHRGRADLSIHEATAEEKQARYERMMASFGAGKGLFASAEEVDEYIRRERDAWDD